MTDLPERVTAGVDAHTDTHHVAVLNARGRLLGNATFPATARGYAQLAGWLEQHGELDAVGVESTGSYAAALVRTLTARGLRVVEVNQPHPHARHRRGKSDPIDAELAARAVQSGTATAVPKLTSGPVEAIRVLRLAREGAVKARSAALGQLADVLLTAPAELREQLDVRRSLKGKATLCARLRPDPQRIDAPLHAAKLALRSIAHRIASLDEEISGLDHQLAAPPTSRHRRPACLASRPATPASCSSPPARTSSGSPTKPPSPPSAPPPRPPPPPAAPAATASTAAATAKPTAPST